MSQINKKFIKSNAVDETKIRLSNNAPLKARNAADSADVNIVKVNASDRIEFSSVPQATSDASAANDLVRYSQFQALLEGLKPKEAVRVASIGANVVIASALEAGDTLDTITLVAGDRVLLKDQTDPLENGIYIVQASGAAVRSSDMNASSEFPGSYTVQSSGSAGNIGKAFVCTVASTFVLATDPVTFVLFKSTAIVTGHDMITLSGTELSVDLAAVSGLESSSAGNAGGQLRIKLEASNPSLKIDGSNQLAAKLDAAGAITSGASGLIVGTDASTIEISSNALRVKDLGITLAKMASDSVDENKIVSTSFNAAGAVTGGSGTKIAVQVDASTIEISANALRVKDAGITSAKLAAAVAGDMIAGGAGTALSVDLHTTSGLESSNAGNAAGQLRVKLEASNPTLQIDGSNQLAAKLSDGLVSSATGIKVRAYREAEITLSGGDITNQYIELSAGVKLIPESAEFVCDLPHRYGVDFDIDNSGAQSKFRFDSTNLPSSDLATGGAAALVAGDKIYIKGIRI